MFYVLEGFDEAQLSSRQSSSVTTLVREGVRRMHETRYFRSRIPSVDHVPVRSTLPATGASPDADDVYDAIDGVRSVIEICRVLGQSEFDVSRALFQLLQAGLVLIRAPRPKPEACAEIYNRAITLILRELDAMDEGDEVRAQLAAWVQARPAFSAIVQSAGPSDDGMYDAARVGENAARARERVAVEEEVARGFWDLASYALFLARPHTRRAEQARSRGEPITARKRLSQRVVEMLAPLTTESKRGEPKR